MIQHNMYRASKVLRGICVRCWFRDSHTVAAVRPPEDIPGPRSLPLIGTMYKFLPGGEYYNIKWNDEIASLKFKKYGSIVRQEYTPGRFITSLYDPQDFERVYKKEGKYPTRPRFEFVTMYAQSRNRQESLTSRQGEDWFKARSLIQKPMMRPQSISAYIPRQVLITDEFITYLRDVRNPQTGEVSDVLNQFRKWSMEAVGVVCYNRRLGALTENPDADLQEYMEAIFSFVDSVHDLIFNFPSYKYFHTKALKRFYHNYDVIYSHSDKYIREVLANKDEDQEETMLRQMLARTDGSAAQTELVSTMSLSILTAGTDSTAISLTKCLYLLAKHPDIQEKLYEEICEQIPVGEQVTNDTLNRVPYLRAVVKETHRYMGASSTGTRILDEDIVIQGYKIPAKELILLEHRVASMEDSNFEDAKTFKPERYLRDNPQLQEIHPYALLPFGIGPRMCIGKRLADQELYLGLLKVIQAFRVEYHHGEIKEKTRGFAVPDRPVHIAFIDR